MPTRTRTSIHAPGFRTVLAAIAFAFALVAQAAEQRFSLLLDTDNNAATGCTVATVNGPAAGIEQVWTTVITTDPSAATVTRIERQTCTAGNLGAPVVVAAAGWPAGLGHGASGSAAIETYVPLANLPATGTIKVWPTSYSATGSQDAAPPFLVALAPAPAPSPQLVPLSPWLLPPLSLVLLGAALWWRRRSPQSAPFLIALVLAGVSTLVWAATVTLDGNTGDWNAVAPATTNAGSTAPANAKILAVSHQSDATRLYVRIDADVRLEATGNQAPNVDAGSDRAITLPLPLTLAGTASDDGLPLNPGALTLTWSLVSGPLPAVTFGNDHALDSTATFYAPGVYVLRLTAFDGALTSTDDVQVTVGTAAPTIQQIADRAIPLGTHFRTAISASDGNALGALAFSLPAAPSGATLNPSPLIDWTPTAAQLGPNTFTARVTNGSGQSATMTFHITVTAANRPPVLAAQADVTIAAGTAFARTLTATDPDAGDLLTFALVSGPPGLGLNGAAVSWATNGVAPGAYPVTVKVTDGAGAFDAKLFTITLTPASALLANNDRYTVAIGQTLNVPAPGVLGNDFGPAGPSLFATKMTEPDKGTLSLFNADGSFSYQAPSLAGLLPLEAKVKGYFGPNGSIDIGYYPPLVADLDGDGKPEVVIWDGDNMYAYTVATGALLFFAGGSSLPPPYNGCAMYGRGASRFAVADIDDSGLPSIVMGLQCAADNFNYIYHAQDGGSRVIAIAYDPSPGNASHWKVKWMSAPLSPQIPFTDGDGHPWVPMQGMSSDVAFTVARLDPAEKPTILFGKTYGAGYCGQVIPGKTDQYCRIVFAVDGLTGGVKTPYYSAPADPGIVQGYHFHAAGSFSAPIVADFDDSSELSVIYEGTWWAKNGTIKRQFDGTAATGTGTIDAVVADLDGDGKMELIALDDLGGSGTGSIKAWKLDGTLLWSIPFPRSFVVNKLTVADIDRDGKPDILFGLVRTLYAINHDGSIKWIRQIDSDDWVSPFNDNDTPVYDLDGDGIPEIVVQLSKNKLLFLSGVTGETQTSWIYPNNADGSGQSVRTPIVADLTGNGQANVAFYRDVNLNFTDFFVVLESNNAPWLPAPKHYNQRAYWETNFVVDATHDNSVPLAYTRQSADPRTNVFGVQPQAPYVVPPKPRYQTSFTYTAGNGTGTSQPATVDIDITPPNRPPKFTSRAPTVCLDGGFREYQPTASDPDIGDTLSWTLVSGDLAYQDFTPATGRITYACGFSFGPPRSAVLVVTDSHGASAYQSMTIAPVAGTATVPTVVGSPQADAATALTNAGFAVGTITQLNAPAAIGEVIGQFPTGGATALQGESIDLTISAGPVPTPVPDVVGQLQGAAGTTLGGAGFTVDTTLAYSNTIEAGTVMAQSPPAGTLLAPVPANPVTLTVSAGTGLALRVNSNAIQAGASFALLTVAIDLNGVETPFANVAYAINPAAGATGTAPTLNGANVLTSASTRGSYLITATENGGAGRVAQADLLVLPADANPAAPYWGRFARFSEALADYVNAVPALQKAALTNDKAGVLALVQPIQAKLALVDLRAMSTSDPWAAEQQFMPTMAQVMAAGFLPTAEDQFFIATAKALAEVLAKIVAELDPADTASVQEVAADIVEAQKLATLLANANPTVAGLAGAHPAMASIGAALMPAALDGWLNALIGTANKSAKVQTKMTLPTLLLTGAILVGIGAMGVLVINKMVGRRGAAYRQLVDINGLRTTLGLGTVVIPIKTSTEKPQYDSLNTGVDVEGITPQNKVPSNFTLIALSENDLPAASTILEALTKWKDGNVIPVNTPEVHAILQQALNNIYMNAPGVQSHAWENHPLQLDTCTSATLCAGLTFPFGIVAHEPCTASYAKCIEKTVILVWDQTGALAVSELFDMYPKSQ